RSRGSALPARFPPLSGLLERRGPSYVELETRPGDRASNSLCNAPGVATAGRGVSARVETSASGLLEVLVPLLFLLAPIARALVVLRGLRQRSRVHSSVRVRRESGGPDHTHASVLRQRPCRDERHPRRDRRTAPPRGVARSRRTRHGPPGWGSG